MNKKEEVMFRNLERNLQELKSLISDLEERSEKETFKEALSLFKEGWGLENWGAFLTDTDEEITLTNPSGKEVGYWADGAGRNTDEAFGIIGVENTEKGEEILFYLSNLTEEEKEK